MDILRCTEPGEVADQVAAAAAAGRRLEVIGLGTKREWGEPVVADAVLDVSALAGVVAYEPEELVLSVRPGTPLPEVVRLLAAHRQHLAFEPPDYGWVLSGRSSWGSLGGALAVGAGGPRRFRAGGARDHLLGITAVNGLGEVFHAGGRVVKNVTGYDLPKLLCGAFGTLGVVVEAHVKVLPAPEDTATLVLRSLSDLRAIEAMGLAARSPHEPTGLAHWPDEAEGPRTLVRVEGPRASVEHRVAALRSVLADFHPDAVLDAEASAGVWAAVRDGRPVLDGMAAVWLASVPPTGAVPLLEGARPDRWLVDHAGGRVWLAFASARPDEAERVRGALVQGGHATLLRVPSTLRGEIPVFPPRKPVHATLSARVRAAFDPEGILNPGRMGA